MSKKYTSPPIIEALCEFQFVPSQPWDFTIPGLLYERIKDRFPEKQQQMSFGIGFEPKEGGLEQKVELSQRIQFLRPDRTALVQVGPDLLTINHLKPYPTWDRFRPLVLENLRIYQEISNPKGFKRIGLRYINKMEIPGKSIELAEYFNFYPFIPSDLPQVHGAFSIRVEVPYEEGRDRLLMTLGSTISEKPDTLSCILDLDYVMATPEKVSLEQATNWVETAHTIVEEAFEACITDKCRNLFEEEK